MSLFVVFLCTDKSGSIQLSFPVKTLPARPANILPPFHLSIPSPTTFHQPVHDNSRQGFTCWLPIPSPSSLFTFFFFSFFLFFSLQRYHLEHRLLQHRFLRVVSISIIFKVNPFIFSPAVYPAFEAALFIVSMAIVIDRRATKGWPRLLREAKFASQD